MSTTAFQQAKRIKLTQGKYALVDDCDYEQLNQYKWHYSQGYAARRQFGKVVLMHRQIMQTPEGMDTDHINHNGVDNQRMNLRICTPSENHRNLKKYKNGMSPYQGVGRKDNQWRARVSVKGRQVSIGLFRKERHAAMVYDLWAVDLYGEFAKTNFEPI
jgi:hypothetical protein